jgi:hypothetical protein
MMIKKLVLTMCLMPAVAFAHGIEQNPFGGQQSQNQSQSSGSSLVNDYHDRLQIPPTPPALAPSANTVSDCPIVIPKTSATSFLVFSHSEVTGIIYSDVCYALKRGQTDVADKLMCLQSANYAKANPKCAE